MHFFWMRNNLFFIMLKNIYGGQKRSGRKRWTLKQTVKDLSLWSSSGKARPYRKLTVRRRGPLLKAKISIPRLEYRMQKTHM